MKKIITLLFCFLSLMTSVQKSYAAESIFNTPSANPNFGSGLSTNDNKTLKEYSSNIPDYSKVMTVPSVPFIAPSNGIFVVYGSNSSYQIFVNGYPGPTGTAYIYLQGGPWAIVEKNSYITITYTAGYELGRTMLFIPFK